MIRNMASSRRWRRSISNTLVAGLGLLCHSAFQSSGLQFHAGVLSQAPSSTNTRSTRLFVAELVQQDEMMSSVDNRPHDHRAKEARKARRMNHAFKYLYRHEQKGEDKDSIMTPREYLAQGGGYTDEQIDAMHRTFPPLLELDVQRHLRPKMRFLKQTLLGIDPNQQNEPLPEEIRVSIPPHFFGARLERILAPRHAFLMHCNLPHGRELLLDAGGVSSAMFNGRGHQHPHTTMSRCQEFLQCCRNTKQFAALCNRWAREKIERHAANSNIQTESPILPYNTITPRQIEAFDVLFGRGLMPAARDELCQHNNTWPLDYINITAGEVISLLIHHGANPLERDNRGVSLSHWAAGTGNVQGVKALLPHFGDEGGVWVQAERDGSTPLHWAAAGANAREFGVGGHPEVCQFLLSHITSPPGSTITSQASSESDTKDAKRALVNALTRDGNSALMWAAWSGTLETVKFLIRNRAESSGANRNGCTVAHWASSGGNVEVCKYLASTVGVDFCQPNLGGNTPLTHAVAFGRAEVVEWLRNEIVSLNNQDDRIAKSLAWDFVGWTDGDEKRQQVLNLF